MISFMTESRTYPVNSMALANALEGVLVKLIQRRHETLFTGEIVSVRSIRVEVGTKADGGV